MQLTNETALPVAWIEAEDDNWGCDEDDCEEGEVGIFIYKDFTSLCRMKDPALNSQQKIESNYVI